MNPTNPNLSPSRIIPTFRDGPGPESEHEDFARRLFAKAERAAWGPCISITTQDAEESNPDWLADAPRRRVVVYLFERGGRGVWSLPREY